MLELARAAILANFTGQPQIAVPDSPALGLRRGIFVTIHVAGKLRGCIGVIHGSETLRESIVHCAQGAAFHDMRFPSLRPDEVRDLSIEISVLSEPQPIVPEQILIGTHGLYVISGDRHGLLLPQVANEHHLSREQFLQETCRKAGLPRDAWQNPDTQVLGFTCEVFSDDASGAAGGT